MIPGPVRRQLAVLLALPILLTVSALAAAETTSSQAPNLKPPNIVLFYIDDLGWMDLGVQGSTFYETPQTDRLLAEGMRFTNAYSIPGRRLIETMSAGCGSMAVSRLVLRPIGSIDLLMPGKLMPQIRGLSLAAGASPTASVSPARASEPAAAACCAAKAASNSSGGRYPSAECSRLAL